jgi:predicted nucleotidyltransferase component of viral defense system
MKKLTKKQKKVLESLVKSGIIEESFYLAGGTALLIKYGHRSSEDFDFFSTNYFQKDVNFYLRVLEKVGSLKIEMFKEDTLTFFFEGIKCSFFHYPYKLIKPLEMREGIAIASDEDIAAMKSVAIIQRGTKKDFYDLWFLMKKHNWSLNEVKEICKRKYNNLFPEASFERAVIYFGDAVLTEYPEIENSWEEIKNFFIKAVKHPEVSALQLSGDF